MYHPNNQLKPTTLTNLTSQFTPKCPYQLTLLPLHSSSKSFKLQTLTTTCSSSPPSPPSPPSPIKTLISILRTIPDWADQTQERGMQKNRTLYNHTDWVQHRSSLRHVRHFFSSLSSRVILSLVPPVLFFTSFAAVVATYNSAVYFQLLPEFFPVFRASSLPYQLTAPALALLLVFRTEASYSRFVEGKKAWTSVIAAAHDFARLVMAVVVDTGSQSEYELKNGLLNYIIAFPLVLKCYVLYGSDIESDLQHLLEVDDIALIMKSNHRPRCVIEFISQSIRLLKLEDSRRNILESKITYFHEGIGLCEQLKGIPIPLSYTRLTSRFLVLWHLTLPIILWDDCHWIVVPATFISAASLFCIEEVGVLIEDPFPMLALNDLCQKAQNDIQEAIATESVIHSHLAAKQKHHSKEHSPNGRPNS